MVGPEYQGLKERAKLWIPRTYGEWWDAHLEYFRALVAGVGDWPAHLRAEACDALLHAVENQIKVRPCTDLAFEILQVLIEDPSASPSKLNQFFWHWREYDSSGDSEGVVSRRLLSIERRYNTRSLASRFQRYVVDIDWLEWDDDFRGERGKPRSHAKLRVSALAARVAGKPESLQEIAHLMAPVNGTPAIWAFGEQLALRDAEHRLLPELVQLSAESKHPESLRAYLSVLRPVDPELYRSTINALLNSSDTAWLGATLTLCSDYDEALFRRCLDLLKTGVVEPYLFASLRSTKALASIPPGYVKELLDHLSTLGTNASRALLVELLSVLPFDDSSPFDSSFVARSVLAAIPVEGRWDAGLGYVWKVVCGKLIKWDVDQATPLLTALLSAMGAKYRLSYDSYVQPFATELVRLDPSAAWNVIKVQLAQALPQWRSDLLEWMKGDHGFDQSTPRGANTLLPVSEIVNWIQEDPSRRAALIAHAAPRTLDDEEGGQLRRR
jgi:hypothetical protein